MERHCACMRRAVEGVRQSVGRTVQRVSSRIWSGAVTMLREERAQGTTEYAILVGVLVVIAILAIVAFRENLTKLWDAISNGINSL